MKDRDFDDTLKKLSEQVSQFTSSNMVKTSFDNSGMLSKINIKSPFVYYVGIPLLIAIILFFWKPKFVMEEVSINGNISHKKLNFKNLLITTVIITVIISIIIFVYFYQNNKKI